MQEVLHLSGETLHRCLLPAPAVPVSEGLDWGRFDELLTPAYWAAQCWMWKIDSPDHFQLGQSLEEELLACLLGGYGIPAEVGLAAYQRLRSWVGTPSIRDEALLSEQLHAPLQINGREVRYRFARQKARYIAEAFGNLPSDISDHDDRALRYALTTLRGVGPKTASWIVRNSRRSDDVAILDIHLLWIGRHLGIFPAGMAVDRHYLTLEDKFLRFAKAIETPASILDSVMWMTVRRLPSSWRKIPVATPSRSRQYTDVRPEGAFASTLC